MIAFRDSWRCNKFPLLLKLANFSNLAARIVIPGRHSLRASSSRPSEARAGIAKR